MQTNQYPFQATELTVLDRFDVDQQDTVAFTWQTKKYDLPTMVDSMVVLFPNLTENIYTADGSLPTGATRTFDLDTGELNLLNGNLNVGATNITGGIFRTEITGSPAGILVIANSGTAGQFSGDYAMLLSSGNVGLLASAPGNIIRDDAGVVPPVDDSCILEIISTERGVLNPRMTEAQRDAIVSPADYLEITNTTRERKEIFKPFWGWHPVGVVMPDWGYEMIDEITSVTPNNGFSQTQLTGGTRTNSTFPSGQILGLSTGVTTNGESSHLTGLFFLGGIGKKYYKTKLVHSALSTVTDRFVSLAGYNSAISGLSFSDGMFFLYDEGGVFGTATASANWLCVTKNGATTNIVDSGIPVTTTAGAFQTLEILEDGTNSSCIFKIDGVTVYTATTGLPNSSDILCIGERIMKQAGTTARVAYVDYTHVKEKFNTPR